MNRAALLIGLCAVSAIVSRSVFAEESASSAVFDATDANFKDFLAENEVALVSFYAPWCGHCKSLAPEYEGAAKTLKEKGGAALARVDATVETALARQYEVRGYPTLKLFKKGDVIDYSGGRTADAIVEWVEKVTGAAVEVMSESDAVAPAKGALFVARLSSMDGDAGKAFDAVAEKMRMTARFGAIVSDKADNTVTVYRAEDEPVSKKIGSDEAELASFVELEQFPLLGPIDGENYAAYEARSQEIVWFAASEDDFKAHGAAIREGAAQFRADYSFVWLDTGRFSSHAESLGITNLPGLALRLREAGRYVFPESKKFVAKEIIDFFTDVKSGKIAKFLKSEPIPESNDEPVKVVVGDNFNDMVFQEGKDVMLEVYAPWCGHCKKLEPIYTELAEKLADHPHVVIAKMDGTANEPPSADFGFRGFPTMFWVKAGETKPVQYNEARTLEGLLSFIKDNTSKPIEADASEDSHDEL